MRAQALRMTEKLLGPAHTQTVIVARNVATILNRQGQHKEAGVLFSRCAAMLQVRPAPPCHSRLPSLRLCKCASEGV